MSKNLKKLGITASALLLLGGLIVVIPKSQNLLACGWGNSGGQAYRPNQSNINNFNSNAAISKEQAVVIITQHMKKLNPDLRIGNINDVGPLYEAEILSASDEEILQVIGVYKQSGQLVLIN